ncbi:MAG: GntR family transcriptional regulator [Victivallaceae bacterium]|nr:GntR family transcriptional regulator [Victivallaceae bacterium]
MTPGSILKKDQVYQQLRESIISGKLAASDKLPRETDLATELEVSRITLRSSLNRLEQEGFIKRVQGRGTFVSPQTHKPTSNGTIMVVHAIDSGFESSWHYIVPEISRFAQEHQLKTFVTTNTAFEMFSSSDIKAFADKNRIIGIIATMNHFIGNESIISKLQAAEVPVVLAHSGMNDSAITGFASIAVNEKAGWKAAIKHLVQCGHTNIAILGNSGATGFRDNGKAETLKQLAACGASSSPELITQTHFDKSAINNAVKALLNASPKPTAFLCFSDFYAVYVYEVLAKLNLRIPEDIAIMGICGFPDAKLLSPPLSTIDYEYSRLAEMAVKMVIEPKPWFDQKTGKGKLRMKPFALRARKSTEKQSKEVTIDRAYPIHQIENVAFA